MSKKITKKTDSKKKKTSLSKTKGEVKPKKETSNLAGQNKSEISSKESESIESQSQSKVTNFANNNQTKNVLSDKEELKKDQNIITKESKEIFWSQDKIIALSLAIFGVGLLLSFNFYYLPEVILANTEEAIARRNQESSQKEAEESRKSLEENLKKEDEVLKFSENKNWKVEMNFENFGPITINLEEKFAPKTVENFIRLTYRDYYNNTIIHRIVEQPESPFVVIQGGDKENGDGSGGQSAFFISQEEPGNIEDELWLVEPEFMSEVENTLSNEPLLRAPELYRDFEPDTGTIIYPKGLILMAKTSEPDSAGSQFFITLADTRLPALYTAFGKIEENNFQILDDILAKIDPAPSLNSPVPDEQLETNQVTDGVPNQELLISEVKIIQPQVEN